MLIMRYSLTLILLFVSILSFGQKKNKFSLVVQLQPELTFDKRDYTVHPTERRTGSTFNIGFNTSLQYNLSDQLFMDAGLGFISRQLNTKVFIDQTLLPPPYTDSTQILISPKSISFRTLQIPIGIGYSFIKSAKTNFFVRSTYVQNFLLNTKYGTNRYASFKKNYWQGHSINLGFGFDYGVNRKIQLTNSITYSLLNTMREDDYTHGFQNERRITFTHKYLQLSTGVKIKL